MRNEKNKPPSKHLFEGATVGLCITLALSLILEFKVTVFKLCIGALLGLLLYTFIQTLINDNNIKELEFRATIDGVIAKSLDIHSKRIEELQDKIIELEKRGH